MIEPKPIGRFLKTDSEENIIPDVKASHISAVWKPLVQLVVDSLMSSKEVKSVYIRGSVPRGLAVEGFSDADFIYLSEEKNELLEKKIESDVQEKFPFVREVELLRLSASELNKIFAPQARPYFHMLLKTQSLHLAGQDVTLSMAPFKIGLEMVSHVFHLAKEFSKLPQWLSEDAKLGKSNETTKWFCRRVVRSGLEVTMQKNGKYTRDLYLCYEQFAQNYPQYAELMYKVLVNSLNGNHDTLEYTELISFLDQQGHLLR